ncbi:hypothetical protein AYO20_01054 [Fonsecaea nubica]|uniref:BZIP domain-containing protein n=1 Tax=Fonsecaea nubica TaxID=856822 RepID=A0A178DDA5_9EURO|nr:hypothetical protein AYO20_01054 [Fonsecaea nubica]OAL39657.1 hypothetical protein AYO20_01054 [Fonsecaea nubica]
MVEKVPMNRRVRSEAQLERKRQLDRWHMRTKRQTEQRRSEALKQLVHSLRARVAELERKPASRVFCDEEAEPLGANNSQAPSPSDFVRATTRHRGPCEEAAGTIITTVFPGSSVNGEAPQYTTAYPASGGEPLIDKPGKRSHDDELASAALIVLSQMARGAVPNSAASSPESTWRTRVSGHAAPAELHCSFAIPPSSSQLAGALVADTFCSLCSVEHPAGRGCFYSFISRALWTAHVDLFRHQPSDAQMMQLPRMPTIDNFFLRNPERHPLVEILNVTCDEFRCPNDADNVAIYLVMYRLLRWRVYPVARSYEDVPAFYRPTKAQECVPHPVSIDFLAFPELRDILTKHPALYLENHTQFDRDFTESVTVQWPRLEPVFITDEQGNAVRLTDEFESHIFDYDNWAMRDRWFDAYPQYGHAVNRCKRKGM